MSDDADLGFSYRETKSGDIDIQRNGRSVTVLRGKQAAKALARLAHADFEGQQQIMARLTGNYRRGNESDAGKHPRNR